MTGKRRFSVGDRIQAPRNFDIKKHRNQWCTVVYVGCSIIEVRFDTGEQVDCVESDLKAPNKVSVRLRYLILERDNFRCQLCGRSARDGAVLHVDHRTSVFDGGSNEESNLWTLCQDCNLGKGKKSLS